MIWKPELCTGILDGVAIPVGRVQGLETFVLRDLACSWRIVRDHGREHAVFQAGGRSLQLCVSGVSLLNPVHLVVDAVGGRDAVRRQAAGLLQLNSLLEFGYLAPKDAPTEPRGPRWLFVLRALDGRLAGLSDREIAAALFGKERVAADWNDPGEHLRDRIRRAVRRGHRLMRGGYLEMLR